MATTTPLDTRLGGPDRPRRAAGIVADEIGRKRLEALLADCPVELAAAAPTVAELLDLASPLDLIVLAGGGETVARGGSVQLLQAVRPRCPIVLVGPDDNAVVRKALRAGVDGYVPEPSAERTLAPTLNAVLAGQLALPRSIRHRAPWTAFSSRERQVLQLVADGATNQQIAGLLHLSESTIKSHLASSFRKLGVSSRAEAAAAVLDAETGLQTHVAPTATYSLRR